VAKTGRAWKFGFWSDMSLALEVLELQHTKNSTNLINTAWIYVPRCSVPALLHNPLVTEFD
jgi:hypothetical protein